MLQEIPMKPTPEQARKMLRALMRDRLENYGYDYRAWRRLQAQRQRAKQSVQAVSFDLDQVDWATAFERAPLGNRVDWERGSYVVGQSSNEEITNLLRQLVNPSSKWVS
jgi:hypothetical protein